MEIHIGKKIQARARELRIGPSELGKEVNTSRQNMISVYKRESVDALMLWKISKALKYNFFIHYPLSEFETEQQNELARDLKEVKKENNALRKEIQGLEEKNAMLKKINVLLEGKRKSK